MGGRREGGNPTGDPNPADPTAKKPATGIRGSAEYNEVLSIAS